MQLPLNKFKKFEQLVQSDGFVIQVTQGEIHGVHVPE
jgi:hypothetical protein